MDKIYKESLMLDFYGQFLTKRQYEIMDMYLNNNYSLSEIAECAKISRQGVHDNIKRARNLFNSFEQKLGLVKNFSKKKSDCEKILNCLKSIQKEKVPYEVNNILREIKVTTLNIIKDE